MNFIEEISTEKSLAKVVCSNAFLKQCKFVKITLRRVAENLFQAEKLTTTQAFHENICEENLSSWLESNISGVYKFVLKRQ